MFYQMVQNACQRWFASCPVKDMVRYMERRGKLRDAQIEAIKTWLFLKIGCDSRPLAELFCSGRRAAVRACAGVSLRQSGGGGAVRIRGALRRRRSARLQSAGTSASDRAAGGRLRTIFQERFLWRLLYGLPFQSAHGRGQDVFNGGVSLSGTVFRVQ